MLRHYGTSQEGVLGKLKDFYFGKMPIHLTEEYYKNYLYILYIYILSSSQAMWQNSSVS